MEKGLWLAIGVVRKPHGVKGKINITPLADLPGFFDSLEEVLVGQTPHLAKPYRVIQVQFMKKAVLLQLEGLHPEEAAKSVGSFLWVKREQLPPLGEGEYYYQDLMGMAVLSLTGEQLGLVKGIIQTGDSYVLVCKKGGRELLIPFIQSVIKELDQERGALLVDLPQGLE